MRYFAELNRPIGDSIQTALRTLRRRGLRTHTLPHKTSLLVERPPGMRWKAFTRRLKAVLQPKRGSAIVFSEATGNAFVCRSNGRRPGPFRRL
jgi:hypothetical protein